MKLRISLAVVVLAVLSSCATESAILFEGMGTHSRKVSTEDAMAQRYFDQGLALSYGFNHFEAIRSFEEAAKIDPSCAMAYWGQAYALSPNINGEMDEAAGKRAYSAIQVAIANKDHASSVECDLIDALAVRLASPPPKNRGDLDRAYADAMRKLCAKYPDDDDVGFLFADSLMNLHPWDQWTADFKPKEDTEEILATLEQVMAININHPGANHFYIHAMEASATPSKAEPSADRLGGLAPGIGHMVHMPAHIYIQVGRFKDSMECNDKASDLDREYFERTGTQGVYNFYHAHNNHFRVWSAMYQGCYEEALRSCELTLKDLPAAMHGAPGAAEWLAMSMHVHLRFGEWEAALGEKSPRADQPYAVAMWHYARGMAYANTERVEHAQAEAVLFEKAASQVPEDQKVWVIPAHEVLNVAREMLAGETAYHSGNHESAFEHLRAAVVAEDGLRYSEPSPWMMPTRHALGALLLDQGLVEQAEQCYRADLKKHPGNGWSLYGLSLCLERSDKVAEAKLVRTQFDKAWANATVKIGASCFCSKDARH